MIVLSILNNNYGFGAFVNVDIQQISNVGVVKKHVQKHNKATRNMVRGILRFLEGKFTSTYANDDPEHTDDAKNYIPCYISFGDGGVSYGSDGKPIQIHTGEQSQHVPDLEISNWNTVVNYDSQSLVREFNLLSQNRSKIRKQDDTFNNDSAPAGDMDTIVLYCEVAPGEVNMDLVDGLNNSYPRFITEIGLFSSPNKKDNDLLAYVKLGNRNNGTEESPEWETDTLYVRPNDTIIITWFITIVAMSDISVVDSSEELLEPEIGSVDLIIDTED